MLIDSPSARLLLDCGATALLGLHAAAVEVSSIDAVLVSHFHGDHYGGLPFLILAQQFAKRRTPLVVAGPPGVEARVRGAFDALYPGSTSAAHEAVDVRYVELGRVPTQIGGASVTALPVAHLETTAPHGLRVTLDGRTVAYSGDTAWCDALPALADGADLFICECYSFEKRIPSHLDHATLVAHREELRASRTILTHLGPDALRELGRLEFAVASDGLEVILG